MEAFTGSFHSKTTDQFRFYRPPIPKDKESTPTEHDVLPATEIVQAAVARAGNEGLAELFKSSCSGDLPPYTESLGSPLLVSEEAASALSTLSASYAGSLSPHETIEFQSTASTQPLPLNRAAGDDAVSWYDQNVACEVLPTNFNCTRAAECSLPSPSHADSADVPGMTDMTTRLRALASDSPTSYAIPHRVDVHDVSVVEDAFPTANGDLQRSAGAVATCSSDSVNASDSDGIISPPRKRRYRCLADKRRAEMYRASGRAGTKRLQNVSPGYARRESDARVARKREAGRKKQRDLSRRKGRALTETSTASLRSDSEPQNPPTWEVDRIVAMRRTKNGEVLYKVGWRNTWEPARNLHGCADTALAEFHDRQTDIYEE